MRRLFRRRAAVATAALSALVMMAPTGPAHAQADTTTAPAAAAQQDPGGSGPEEAPAPDAVPPSERDRLLGGGWRESEDRLWTTSGDGTGFHVLVAEESRGYAWRTAASLSEPGFETDTWIGNACVTASGQRAVVVYAPRTFTNEPELMTRGAFTAVVDLTSGEVTKLPLLSSLAHFSPGCGAGETAVVSQFSDDASERNATRLVLIDAADGTPGEPLTLAGQVTSAVPHGDDVVAASGANLVRIDAEGERTRLARTRGVPFQIAADADGGFVFLDRTGPDGEGVERAAVARVGPDLVDRPNADAPPEELATGELTAFDLARAADGTVVVTGTAATEGALPDTVSNPGTLPKDARVSTRGEAAVHTSWADGRDAHITPEESVSARPVRAEITALDTRRSTVLQAAPAAEPIDVDRLGQGTTPSPALAPGAAPEGTGAAAASPSDPVDDERYCSVPRGDVNKQAFQPTPRQVEWAVDQAVVDGLDRHVSRGADWKGTGMAAYQPQSLFPLSVLHGDPTGAYEPDSEDEWHIPAQIMLGITAQESNMWQATRYAVPGLTANPLIGNYYGIEYAPDGEQTDPWAVNWADADCGYGITQVTDGMRMAGREKPGETALTPRQQEAVALDYTANIAAGADILADKWNQTMSAGLVVNDGDPRWIENWFFALWAYNSGFYPESSAGEHGGHWGVGWTNNPANPLWKANRTPFLEDAQGRDDYAHAAHPQDWPYPEKVIGWAARPLSAMTAPGEFAAGYRASWWNSTQYRTAAKPPIALFCDDSNDCDPGLIGDDDDNEPGLGACGEFTPGFELHCWWNQAAEWKDCGAAATCGYAVHRFNETFPEQPDQNSSYPPRCSDGLPSGTLVVDDVPDGVYPAGSAGHSCGPIESAGRFSFEFTEWNATYPGKIDLHQIGAAYGNHFWFTHTREEDERLHMKGTWTLDRPIDGWARVLVHIPDHGAHTRQATYEVHGTDSTSPERVVPQRTRENRWVSLGAFRFTGTPAVSLGNYTQDGNGSEDVAWDAVAFQPLPDQPRHQIVAMGDSYSSGEGASDGDEHYYPETNYRNESDSSTRNACHRSTETWSRQAQAPGFAQSVGELDDSLHPDMDYHLTACSGARTYNMHRYVQDNGGELPQLDQGYLDQHTSLVTVSIGGNDARFSHVVQECLLEIGVSGCAGEAFESSDPLIDEEWGDGRDGPYQGLPMDEALPALLHDVVRVDVLATLDRIHEQAPNAKIVLMGYPELFSSSGSCLRTFFGWIGLRAESAHWLNDLAGVLADEMNGAVADARARGVDAYFSDPREDFQGMSVCGDPEQVHGIVTDTTASDDPVVDWPLIGERGLSAQSFHPKRGGATLYADSLERTMSGMGL
ncbi:GDSL-type esterase/lipase family protein [Streptomyces radicis]|uniref:NocE n=1 Tax=Streptomyces radicis TaxID=1750517 RepID=A0A3A9WVN1_9ACTN|nr:GDSL-type esterase/lipase family protein [Streptomyces radicis]RKN10187.1 NocE [Streptomyces radicis]RKN24529.1 NocE [Streptomyces radicis]